jgi:CheY-like chemotaxis protein
MLAVSDTGAGMDAETQAHVFEPFFTTKPLGRGTGLGLSTVYGIVKQSGGYISVDSQRGQGTTFKIFLPAVDDAEQDAPLDPEIPHAAPPSVVGNAAVLLVEDEAGVRHLVSRLLQRCGYTVHAVGTPAEALAYASTPGTAIDLLLTDVVLPEMSGRAVADAVRGLYPQCRVLFMSGYTNDAVVRRGAMEGHAPFLQKPFSGDALLAKVAAVLAGAP